ncbi:MAG: hypothetical protein Q7J86_15325, partial [Bacteroidota bacterium]|nr:hypothetical protein [Bacteroidota bacterium]
MSGIAFRSLLKIFSITAIFLGIFSCGNRTAGDKSKSASDSSVVSVEEPDDLSDLQIVTAVLVSPENPRPGEKFSVMVTGGKSIRKAKITVNSPSGEIETAKSRNGVGLPYWRIDEFVAGTEGNYKVTFQTKTTTESLEFTVAVKPTISTSQSVWKTKQGWDSKTEALYSAWVNALFQGADE